MRSQCSCWMHTWSPSAARTFRRSCEPQCPCSALGWGEGGGGRRVRARVAVVLRVLIRLFLDEPPRRHRHKLLRGGRVDRDAAVEVLLGRAHLERDAEALCRAHEERERWQTATRAREFATPRDRDDAATRTKGTRRRAGSGARAARRGARSEKARSACELSPGASHPSPSR